jgi:hypothetical protein
MSTTKLIIYNLSVLLLLFMFVEIGFRIGVPEYEFYQRTSAADFSEEAILKMDTNWVRQDSILGWVCRPKAQLKFYRTDFWDVDYQINKYGFRSVEFPDITDTTKDRTRVLLLGDSFLFGIFLRQSETIANQMQSFLGDNYEVYNMAIPGWGIDQMYQACEKYTQVIQPDMVILFFIDDDVSRVMEAFYWGAAPKRAYRSGQDSLIYRTPEDGKLTDLEAFFCFNSQVINRLYRIGVMQKAQPLTEVILDNWIKMEHRQDRDFMAVRFPRREQVGHPGLKKYDLGDFFDQHNVFYRDLEAEMSLFPEAVISSFYIEGDDHPSKEGAEFIASKLRQFIMNSR